MATDGKISSNASGEDENAKDCNNDGTATSTIGDNCNNSNEDSHEMLQPQSPIAKKKKDADADDDDDEKDDCEQNDPAVATTPTISSLASSEVSIGMAR
jgi:hypothetical protein